MRAELFERYGIAGEVCAGFGVAFVSVGAGLLVWSDGYSFWWASGRPCKPWDPAYAFHDARDIVTAARRVALRVEALQLPRSGAH
ncbi:hypothetical protein [Acrocarpospora catenulata]|uniref:hypothetical protein n=1 Tax=Acrocarpospora catenulata TaxID=2836182 RepID=UPI001BDB4957|nr:hypothetical protein [Acrocarpospora catenulata]